MVQDPGAFARQPPGADPLRHQAALHDRAGAAHERDDRQCRQSRGDGDDGRARGAGDGLRDHAARARIDRAARRQGRAVALGDHALFGHGAAVGAQRPHARDHPRAHRIGDDHAAVLAQGFREPRDRRRHRALHALGVIERQGQGRADAARLGLHRLGIRQPPSAIREVLRRRFVHREAERLPQLRFQARDRPGGRGAEPPAARVGWAKARARAPCPRVFLSDVTSYAWARRAKCCLKRKAVRRLCPPYCFLRVPQL